MTPWFYQLTGNSTRQHSVRFNTVENPDQWRDVSDSVPVVTSYDSGHSVSLHRELSRLRVDKKNLGPTEVPADIPTSYIVKLLLDHNNITVIRDCRVLSVLSAPGAVSRMEFHQCDQANRHSITLCWKLSVCVTTSLRSYQIYFP